MAFRIQRLREGWTREQLELREHSIIEDKDIILEKLSNGTLLVGGLDISYSGIDSTAFVGVSVVTIGNPSLNKQCETLIVDTFKVEIKGFYVPGFLAFREVPAYIEAIEAFKTKYPDGPTPDIWMVDCNGTLHPR
ncbi:unnamed protein product, partial [Rodentolepis nana]|uniref:Endonuclease V n=1 Tax=Rodentolepis nana TaxID=102285 RepID=A0A0R3TBZ8_RODNA